jgi:tight adherence protein B
MTQPLVWFVGFLAAGAVALLLYGLGRFLQPADELEERVEALLQGLEEEGAASGGADFDVLGRVERTIARRSFAVRTREQLARADLSLTVTEYLLIRVGVTVVGFVLGYLIQRDLIAGLLVGVIFFFLPVFYVGRRQAKRLRDFDGQLPDVLDHMVGSLRAGYGLLQAVEWVGRQVPPPAGYEFNRVVREVQLGRGLQEALSTMVQRIDSDDLALIVSAIKIHHEVGGSLADILEITAHTIRERVRIQREITVLSAQQRYSGYVLMIMPFALGVVLYLLNPQYEKELFAPGPTLCLPIGAIVMMLVGYLLMRRIVDIEV